MDRFHSSDSIELMDWEWDQLTVYPSFILLPFCFLIHSPILFCSQFTHSPFSSFSNKQSIQIHSTLPLLLPMTQLPLLDPLLRVHSPRIIRRRQHLPLRVRRRIHNLPIGLLAHSLRELPHRRRRRQRDLRTHLQTLHLRQTGRMRGRKHLLRLGITR